MKNNTRNHTVKSLLGLLLLPLFLFAQNRDSLILELTRNSIAQGNAEGAIVELESYISQDNQYQPAFLLAQSLCYSELKQIKKAEENLSLVFETEETNSNFVNYNSYWLQGNIYEAKNQPIEEIEAYRKALNYSPTNPEIRITLALALIEADKNEEGLGILDQVIAEGFEHSFIHNNRALALINLNRLNDAKEALEKAFALDPENPFIQYNYYQYYKKKDDIAKACESIARTLTMNVLAYGLESDVILFQNIINKECK